MKLNRILEIIDIRRHIIELKEVIYKLIYGEVYEYKIKSSGYYIIE